MQGRRQNLIYIFGEESLKIPQNALFYIYKIIMKHHKLITLTTTLLLLIFKIENQ